MGRPARREHHRRRKQRWSAPNAAAERPAQVPRRPPPGQHADRGDRAEQVQRPVAGIVPGLERHPLKKLEPDQEALLRLLRRWQDEAAKAGRTIARITVAFEAGRDGSGWHAGCAPATSRPTSSTPRASPSHASTGGPRRTGSTPGCSSAPSSAGYGASRATAAWRRCRPSRRRTPGVRTASVRAWWASEPAS